MRTLRPELGHHCRWRSGNKHLDCRLSLTGERDDKLNAAASKDMGELMSRMSQRSAEYIRC